MRESWRLVLKDMMEFQLHWCVHNQCLFWDITISHTLVQGGIIGDISSVITRHYCQRIWLKDHHFSCTVCISEGVWVKTGTCGFFYAFIGHASFFYPRMVSVRPWCAGQTWFWRNSIYQHSWHSALSLFGWRLVLKDVMECQYTLVCAYQCLFWDITISHTLVLGRSTWFIYHYLARTELLYDLRSDLVFEELD